jgi:hypothetical protein
MNGGPDQMDSSQRGSPVPGQMARRSRALTHLKPLARAGQPWAFRGKLEMYIECADQDTGVLLLHC